MNIDKPSAQTDIPGKGLFARYPLTFYFIIAYVGTWLVWSLFVSSRNGAGLLPFRSPMSYMITIFRRICDDKCYRREGRSASLYTPDRAVARGHSVASVRPHRHPGNHDARHHRSARNSAIV